MKVKYVNANIKSIEEAVERLIKGEIFYLFLIPNENAKNIIYYDESLSYRFGTRTSIYLGNGDYGYNSNRMPTNFNSFSDWKIERKIEWYDNIPEQGILCKVADEESDLINPTEEKFFAIIKKYDEGRAYPFRISENSGWKFAIPVLLNDNILLENNY